MIGVRKKPIAIYKDVELHSEGLEFPEEKLGTSWDSNTVFSAF